MVPCCPAADPKGPHDRLRPRLLQPRPRTRACRHPRRPAPRRAQPARHHHHLHRLRRRRDWLLLAVHDQIFVRCRCAHEWREPDLIRADFDRHYVEPEHEWDDFDTAMRALAFDGLLAGTTWNLD